MPTLGPQLPPASRWRSLGGLLLALLVQGAGWSLMQASPPRPHAGQPQHSSPLLLWLPTPVRPATPPARARVRAAENEPRHAGVRSQAKGGEAPSEPAMAASPTSPETAAVNTAAEARKPAAGSAPLNLALPARRAASQPESMLGQMLNDPRTQREKRGIAWAVADAAGTLPTTVQDSTDGTGARLIRQGSKCLRVRESRAKLLSPMDEQFRSAPAQVSPCVND